MEAAPKSALEKSRVEETKRELERFAERTPRSSEYFARGKKVMPGGVPSSFQTNEPWPVYIERGRGADVWDVDGNEYVDFHNGFGVMCVGHANPTIAAAVNEQVATAPTSPRPRRARSSWPRS